MNDRIKLAEAMGWTRRVAANPTILGLAEGSVRWHTPSGAICAAVIDLPFDPRTDANDDYAVLEWAKTQDADFQYKFQMALHDLTTDKWFSGSSWNYTIGDYARAALKVIGNERLLRAAQEPCPLA